MNGSVAIMYVKAPNRNMAMPVTASEEFKKGIVIAKIVLLILIIQTQIMIGKMIMIVLICLIKII